MANPVVKSELRKRQELFVWCTSQWLAYFYATHAPNGYSLTRGEGYVGDSIDKPGEDSPHLRRGGHFNRTADDWNLFGPDGAYISNGDHPVWLDLGEKWEGLHPLARWGGRFGDGNHLSIELPWGTR